MRRLLFAIVTIGERPEVAECLTRDWLDYTDDFIADHSSAECVFELLQGALSYVTWRITRKSEATLVPFALMLALQIAIVTVLTITGDVGRFGLGVDLMLVGLVSSFIWFSLRRPWDLSFRWGFAVYLVVFGITDIFAALTVSPATPLNVGSFTVSGLGAILVGSSAMRQRLILGSSLTAMIILSSGALLAVIRWTWDTRAESVQPSVATAALGTFLASGIIFYLWRVWWGGQLLPQSPASRKSHREWSC